MKDKSFKVTYQRTEKGGLSVWIHKDNQFFADFIVFPDKTMWVELGDTNKGALAVFPHNATHRVWTKEVCTACGWESKPHEGWAVGFGGTLSCPDCEKTKRNGPGVESSYGNVHSIELNWETKLPLATSSSKQTEPQK